MRPTNLSWILFLTLINSLLFAQHDRTEHWHQRNQQFIRELDFRSPGKIIFLGNSITEGFDLDLYFPVTRPINRGISGDHIDGLLERLETSVLRLKPSRLYILIGINDIGAGDPDTIILDNAHRLMDALKVSLPDSAVFVQSILPTTTAWPNCPKEKIIRLNNRIHRITETYGFDWINLYPFFVDSTGYLRQGLTDDGLHLNEAGYRIWAEVLLQNGLE